MKRILKIITRLNQNNFEKDVDLTVVDENGNDLQGRIHIDKIDDIKLSNYAIREQENKKYYVYNPAESKPKKIYNTYAEALEDAKSVARRYDRCNIYVLEIVSEIQKTAEIREIVNEFGQVTSDRYLDWIPF